MELGWGLSLGARVASFLSSQAEGCGNSREELTPCWQTPSPKAPGVEESSPRQPRGPRARGTEGVAATPLMDPPLSSGCGADSIQAFRYSSHPRGSLFSSWRPDTPSAPLSQNGNDLRKKTHPTCHNLRGSSYHSAPCWCLKIPHQHPVGADSENAGIRGRGLVREEVCDPPPGQCCQRGSERGASLPLRLAPWQGPHPVALWSEMPPKPGKEQGLYPKASVSPTGQLMMARRGPVGSGARLGPSKLCSRRVQPGPKGAVGTLVTASLSEPEFPQS